MMPPDASPPLERPPNPAIGRLAFLFARDHDENGLSPGDRAELRRMDSDAVLPPAFWRQIVTLEIRNEREERAWAILIQAMLEASSPEAEPVGIVLAHGERAYAESRFIRLLRARGRRDVAHEVRQATRWCAAQGRRLRFADRRRSFDGFGPFILAAAQDHDDEAERRAHAIARDYFSTLQRASRANED